MLRNKKQKMSKNKKEKKQYKKANKMSSTAYIKYTPEQLATMYNSGKKETADAIHEVCQSIFDKLLSEAVSKGNNEFTADPAFFLNERLCAIDFDKWLLVNQEQIYAHIVPEDLSSGKIMITYALNPKNPNAKTWGEKVKTDSSWVSQYR